MNASASMDRRNDPETWPRRPGSNWPSRSRKDCEDLTRPLRLTTGRATDPGDGSSPRPRARKRLAGGDAPPRPHHSRAPAPEARWPRRLRWPDPHRHAGPVPPLPPPPKPSPARTSRGWPGTRCAGRQKGQTLTHADDHPPPKYRSHGVAGEDHEHTCGYIGQCENRHSIGWARRLCQFTNTDRTASPTSNAPAANRRNRQSLRRSTWTVPARRFRDRRGSSTQSESRP